MDVTNVILGTSILVLMAVNEVCVLVSVMEPVVHEYT